MLLALSQRGVQSEKMRCICISVWLFSPFTATISTRGNGEALVTCMNLGVLLLLQYGRVMPAALLYGLAVHWRIYPIVYSLPILRHLATRQSQDGAVVVNQKKKGRTEDTSLFRRLYSKDGLLFGVVSGMVFILLGTWMYAWYGQEFLQETYLYHLSRVDPRHNFSPYFYPAYLQYGTNGLAMDFDIVATVYSAVSSILLVFIGYSFGPVDLAGSFMLQTMSFVAFNKVSTAQYFVWYLSWLPIMLPLFAKVPKQAQVWNFALSFFVFEFFASFCCACM